MDAVLRLLQQGAACCRFYRILTGDTTEVAEALTGNVQLDEPEVPSAVSAGLNESQVRAVESSRALLSLIWGPPGMVDCIPQKRTLMRDIPGTGKTTVVIHILWDMLTRNAGDLPKILMTASTHNGEHL